jgi:uncharacterized protein
MSEATAEKWEMPKHGEICWAELSTSNVEGCKEFYSDMFGWTYSGGADYQEIHLGGGKQFGGLMQKAPELESVPSHWLSYVSVNDIDASMAKAVELGGNVVVPTMDIPKTGRFGVISDPSGAIIAMITLSGME